MYEEILFKILQKCPYFFDCVTFILRLLLILIFINDAFDFFREFVMPN